MTALVLTGVAFLFANNITPVINLKLNALKYDIIVTKPAFDIKEGVFYNKIDGFVIKIGKKEKDDSTIRNVVIYERNYGLQDRMLIAESGIMRVTPDKRFLEFILHNGWRYEENGARYSTNTEFIRLGFKEYKKVMDLSSFTQSKTDDTLFKADAKMLSVRQLNIAIDSLTKGNKLFYERARRELYFAFARNGDSNWAAIKPIVPKKVKALDSLLSDSMRRIVNERALAQINNVSSSVQQIASDYKSRQDVIRRHWIEWNRKFTLSAGCLVLFMIGAPLGSIIRKGGLGSPLIFAIIFFVVYYILNTIGEKMAKEGVTTPGGGMWLSTFVLIPIGLFLTSKAMRDSQLFNKEYYYRTLKRVRQWIGKEKVKKEKLN
jgi:lipopolysaccharide export system permease protein